MQPSGDLLDSRPEQIVAQYLADYIAVAGTFPCAADLASYPFRDIHVGDQFLLGHGCRVQRPVASATVLSVWVHHKG
ncbi:MAG TPA: hypothetical protein VFU88_09760, partial [Ktedonobacterales bacterium]|nr:hypothetical protein [Ktedonobacterales bacterium]